MKSKIILLLSFIFCAALSGYAQEKTFLVSIIQDGNTITPVIGNDITLKRSPFKIQVKLNKLDGVFLYASFKDSIYKLSGTDKIPDFESLPSMAMAETSFNSSQELLISSEGWAYWFYDPKLDWHRFDKDIMVEGDNVTGTKSIKQFYDVTSGNQMPVSEVKEPLYLFFVSAKEGTNHMLVKELQRYKIRINWN